MTESSTQPTFVGELVKNGDSDLVTGLFSFLGLFGMLATVFIGTGLGIQKVTPSICAAAEIKIETMTAVAALVFILSPLIFSFILFFFLSKIPIDTTHKAFKLLGSYLIGGIGIGLTAYTLGVTYKSTILTYTQQKKFRTIFLLLPIFIEFIALMSIILAYLNAQ